MRRGALRGLLGSGRHQVICCSRVMSQSPVLAAQSGTPMVAGMKTLCEFLVGESTRLTAVEGRIPPLLLLSVAQTLSPASVKAPLALPVSIRTTAGL